MATRRESSCPGCGLRMPVAEGAIYRGYYNTTPQCWAVYTEVLGAEFGNAALFGQVHQLTVDTYAVQHAGAAHKDKSVLVHLTGLHLVLDRGRSPTDVPPLLQHLVKAIKVWPHYAPPADCGAVTVLDVALSDSTQEHIRKVREWADLVWKAWSPYHAEVVGIVQQHLEPA